MSVELIGLYRDGVQSTQRKLRLIIDDNGLTSFSEKGLACYSINEIRISSRVGNTPRLLSFPGGEQFETRDNNALDDLLKKHKNTKPIAYWLVSHKGLIGALVIVFFAAGFLLVQYGIPASSKVLVNYVPVTIDQSLADGALDELDDHIFKPSKLEKSKRMQIRQRFDQIAAQQNYNIPFRLYFRDGGNYIGANAFALPNGTVVITDQLINISQHPSEIDSILLHEIAHVTHRHSLRGAIESASVGIWFALFIGDVSSGIELLYTLPAAAFFAKYSRSKEAEADDYALNYMLRNDIDPIYFANIMQSMVADAEKRQQERKIANSTKEASNDNEPSSKDSNEPSKLDYLLELYSSHPNSQGRIDKFKQASLSNTLK